MEQDIEKKGPRGYRFLVITLNVVLALLVYWFLGFIMDDISNQPGPDLQQIQKKYQDPALVKDEKTINDKIQERLNTINEQQQQQKIIETSIHSYRDTMNQLLDLQKASIQKGVTFSEGSEKNLQEVTNLYLNFQKQFQDLNSSITKANLEVQQLQNKVRDIDTKLSKQNEEGTKEYNNLWTQHNWIMAGLQLLILIPLLLISFYVFRKYKESPYKTMIIAIGVAIFFKIAMVMQNYFPSFIFKYILVLVLIYLTAKILISKLRMMSTPNRSWLDKQYSESYQKGKCPMCEFSIKPSISKFFITENKNTIPSSNYHYLDNVSDYTCPCCGELLFEKCNNCSQVRYSLLSYCDSCGTQKQNEFIKKE